MLASSPDMFLKPLTTSYAIQGDPESALILIKEAKEAQLAREASNSQASTSGTQQHKPTRFTIEMIVWRDLRIVRDYLFWWG
jgi:hypothetical protein